MTLPLTGEASPGAAAAGIASRKAAIASILQEYNRKILIGKVGFMRVRGLMQMEYEDNYLISNSISAQK